MDSDLSRHEIRMDEQGTGTLVCHISCRVSTYLEFPEGSLAREELHYQVDRACLLLIRGDSGTGKVDGQLSKTECSNDDDLSKNRARSVDGLSMEKSGIGGLSLSVMASSRCDF
ncbi:hypothetical protein R1flu_001750 [Riccia fluitans]|uniref:Uncharacterized protein n=1 Tax=Riccia fluitans TaxID=41844 RepID=A0ABD1Y4M4_9MARC